MLAQPKVNKLLSSEHFSVDGTLDGGRNDEQDFHGAKRSNETHASITGADARLYKKESGKEAKLCLMGHALRENRNGLIVDALATRASGDAERLAAREMIGPYARRIWR